MDLEIGFMDDENARHMERLLDLKHFIESNGGPILDVHQWRVHRVEHCKAWKGAGAVNYFISPSGRKYQGRTGVARALGLSIPRDCRMMPMRRKPLKHLQSSAVAARGRHSDPLGLPDAPVSWRGSHKPRASALKKRQAGAYGGSVGLIPFADDSADSSKAAATFSKKPPLPGDEAHTHFSHAVAHLASSGKESASRPAHHLNAGRPSYVWSRSGSPELTSHGTAGAAAAASGEGRLDALAGAAVALADPPDGPPPDAAPSSGRPTRPRRARLPPNFWATLNKPVNLHAPISPLAFAHHPLSPASTPYAAAPDATLPHPACNPGQGFKGCFETPGGARALGDEPLCDASSSSQSSPESSYVHFNVGRSHGPTWGPGHVGPHGDPLSGKPSVGLDDPGISEGAEGLLLLSRGLLSPPVTQCWADRS